MTLQSIVASVEAEERTLILTTPTDSSRLVEDVREYVASQNVEVIQEVSENPEDEGAILKAGQETLAEVSLDALRALVDPQIVRRLGESVPYEPLLNALSDTTFTSYDRGQMLSASREIEDRAWRQGFGNLYAGFQRYSIFEDQREVYDQLAESELNVHVFAEPDVSPPDGQYMTHSPEGFDIERWWFVVYDGGDRESQASALLAEERSQGEYYGFWTYDPSLVEDIMKALPDVTTRIPDQ